MFEFANLNGNLGISIRCLLMALHAQRSGNPGLSWAAYSVLRGGDHCGVVARESREPLDEFWVAGTAE